MTPYLCPSHETGMLPVAALQQEGEELEGPGLDPLRDSSAHSYPTAQTRGSFPTSPEIPKQV